VLDVIFAPVEIPLAFAVLAALSTAILVCLSAFLFARICAGEDKRRRRLEDRMFDCIIYLSRDKEFPALRKFLPYDASQALWRAKQRFERHYSKKILAEPYQVNECSARWQHVIRLAQWYYGHETVGKALEISPHLREIHGVHIAFLSLVPAKRKHAA